MQTIFDLGMHMGQDTAYYLVRGFRVIALEPNPALAAKVETEQQDAIAQGRLVILREALADAIGEAKFYVSAKNDEWSSLESWRAGEGHELTVPTTTFAYLVERFGQPHFVKCDIEGADGMFCRQLVYAEKRPAFVSVEGIAIEWLALLSAAGYRHFKLANQAKIRRLTPTIRYTANGQEHEWRFGSHSSGPFGEEVEGPWLSFQETAQRWLDFARLKVADPDIVMDNWFDFHAKL